jgi:hypothetical protein
MKENEGKRTDCTRRRRLELANILEGVYNFRKDEQDKEAKEKAKEAKGKA